MNVPVFIDITYEEQAEELRAYFKSLGADIGAERSELGLEADLSAIIAVCEASFTAEGATETDVQGIMNGIVSMLALCSGDKTETLILALVMEPLIYLLSRLLKITFKGNGGSSNIGGITGHHLSC